MSEHRVLFDIFVVNPGGNGVCRLENASLCDFAMKIGEKEK